MQPKQPFYKDVRVFSEDQEKYFILVDEKNVYTPRGNILSVSFLPIAHKLCNEFEEQKTKQEQDSMMLTRILYTAIDLNANEKEWIIEKILQFASSDMLFYQVTYPVVLQKQQEDFWNPVMQWASSFFQLEFCVSKNLLPVQQNSSYFSLLRGLFEENKEPLYLYAFYLMTMITGSVLLSLAYSKKYLSAEDVWKAAYIEEDWQMKQWGEEEDLLKKRELQKKEFDQAAFILSFFSF